MSARIQATPGSATSFTANIESKSSFVTTGATVGTSETSLVIPVGAKAFRLQLANSAGAAVLTIASSSGGTASDITSFDVYAGSSYSEEFLTGDSTLTLYIKSTLAATPVQLLYWV